MAQYHFHLDGTWSGGRNGGGEISSGKLQTRISAPAELNGPGTGANPEEMLLGSAATCYLITLAAVLENRKLPVSNLTISTEGVVNDEGGFRFERIIHRPRIVLAAGATPEQVETARKGAERAERACMISKALHGNVEILLEPEVTVAG